MLKRLPILFAALLALSACNSQTDTSATLQPSAPVTATAATTAAPVAASETTQTLPPATASTAADNAPATLDAPIDSPAAEEAVVNSAPAAPFVDSGKWVEGKNYFLIDPAQPTAHPGKIEVTEVFSYGCPACNAFHTTAQKIATSLPANAVMAYLPASFIPQENWPMLQRAYYAAQAMGLAVKANDAMYDATWKTNELSAMNPAGTGLKPANALPTIADAAKVYAKFGADPAEFEGIANSFATNIKMKRADELIKAYGVEQTPTMVVNGKYRYTVGSAGGYAQAIELTQWLVAKETAGR